MAIHLGSVKNYIIHQQSNMKFRWLSGSRQPLITATALFFLVGDWCPLINEPNERDRPRTRGTTVHRGSFAVHVINGWPVIRTLILQGLHVWLKIVSRKTSHRLCTAWNINKFLRDVKNEWGTHISLLKGTSRNVLTIRGESVRERQFWMLDVGLPIHWCRQRRNFSPGQGLVYKGLRRKCPKERLFLPLL